jgi:two-component system sensor histidine kinase/response regulator
LAEIKEAVRLGDAEALWRAAHTLKGSVGNFTAKKPFEVSQRLETMGRDRDLDTAGEACATLERELTLLYVELRRLARDRPKAKMDKAER